MANLIVFMGATGAGKSVQADRLAEARGWVHFSTGRLLRQDARLSKMLQSGRLMPSAEVEQALEKAVLGVPQETTVILDGFPRLVEQAEWLETAIQRWSRQLTQVILIDIDEHTSATRLAERGRSDDSSAAQKEKWDAYQRTIPVIDFYRQKNLLDAVDGVGTMDQVSDRIKDVLK
jgi:adenylate kinase